MSRDESMADASSKWTSTLLSHLPWSGDVHIAVVVGRYPLLRFMAVVRKDESKPEVSP